ncbi:LysR family transcriptional regulator [Undibacterium arcticum]
MEPIVALKVYFEVMKHGSFSAAARAADIAVSSVTRQVDALEASLGTQLLVRTTHGIRPTEAGGILLERAKGALGELEDAFSEVRELNVTVQGKIRLAAPMTFGRRFLAPVLVDFLTQYPAVEVDLSLSDSYVNLAQEGFDLAIRVGKQHDPDLLVYPLTSHHHVLCANPDYLARAGTPTSLADLKQCACLIHAIRDLPTTWVFRVDGKTETFFPRGPLLSEDSELLFDAACAGLGITQLPYWTVKEALKSGRLSQVLPDFEVISHLGDMVYIVTPPHRRESFKTRTLRDFLLSRLGHVGET